MFNNILKQLKIRKECNEFLKHRFYTDEFSINGYKMFYDFDLASGGSFFVYFNEKEIAKADMHFNYPNAELHRIYVDEEYRLNGIGTTIITKIIEWCKEHNITRIKVHPYAEHSKEFFEKGITKGLPQDLLIDFYKKCGFTEEKDEYLYANINRDWQKYNWVI